MYDITDEKAAEQTLRVALQKEQKVAADLRELNEMKNSFLQAVSHDLRTPLTSIMGSALTLKRSELTLSPEDASGLMDIIASNAVKLNRLLNDLLDVDRLSRGLVEPQRSQVDIRELVERVLRECELDGRTVEVDVPAAAAAIDASQVERILENLVTNATRYTPAGSPIWVKAQLDRGDVLLTVEDAGPGVPDEMKEAIFEAFRQGREQVRHSPGVGIGLSLVARFAELHGGRAWVEDRPGGGASFNVLLPAEAIGRAGGARCSRGGGNRPAGSAAAPSDRPDQPERVGEVDDVLAGCAIPSGLIAAARRTWFPVRSRRRSARRGTPRCAAAHRERAPARGLPRAGSSAGPGW